MMYNRQSGGSVTEHKNAEEIYKKVSSERSGQSSDTPSVAENKENVLVIKKLSQVRVKDGKLKVG